MSDRSLVVVTAGLSQPSSTRLLADRLASAASRLLRAAGVEPHFEVIELRALAQGLASNLVTGFPDPRLRNATAAVTAADGVIAVTPIFNASYSGLFKTFFDVLERDSLAGVPVLIAATAGTARHSLALEHAVRPLFAYMGAATVPTSVFAAPEDWGDAGAPSERDLVDRIERAATELATAVAAHARPARVDADADPLPFERLLADPPRG